MDHLAKVVKRTVILYDLYKKPSNDRCHLHNLHTISQLLLDPKIPVTVEQEFDEEKGIMITDYNLEKEDTTHITK